MYFRALGCNSTWSPYNHWLYVTITLLFLCSFLSWILSTHTRVLVTYISSESWHLPLSLCPIVFVLWNWIHQMINIYLQSWHRSSTTIFWGFHTWELFLYHVYPSLSPFNCSYIPPLPLKLITTSLIVSVTYICKYTCTYMCKHKLLVLLICMCI